MLLLDLELCLQLFENELASFGLPWPTQEDLSSSESVTSTEPVVIREEKDYDKVELVVGVQDVIPIFRPRSSRLYLRPSWKTSQWGLSLMPERLWKDVPHQLQPSSS